MSDQAFTPRRAKGIAHLYNEKLIAFQHTPDSKAFSPFATNILLFIGGLGDNILTVPYPGRIAENLSRDWCLIEIMLTSSGRGFSTSSLRQDAEEIAQCVAYFKERMTEGEFGEKGRVVLMGHSTGCQDVMQYLVGDANKNHPKYHNPKCEGEMPEAMDDPRQRPEVHGAILQAPVSDREGMAVAGYDEATFRKATSLAEYMIRDGRGEDVLPLELSREFFDTVPICARRFLALSQRGGDDDFFSSDLDRSMLAGTFGRIPQRTRLCVLYSGNDEYVPQGVDKEGLIKTWKENIQRGEGEIDWVHSGVVKGASHSLKGDPEAVVEEFVNRVLGFLNDL